MHRSRSHLNISIARKTLAHAFVRSPCRILVVIVVLCFLALSILQLTNETMDIKSTYFISHGSPTLAIDKELPARHFLEDWQKKFMRSKPRAILIVSAHWDTKYPAVNTPSRHSTIHDFYGFPREMYQLRYDAPGAPELAKRVKELLISSGFKTVKEDPSRGLDHGAWVPLSLMYPEVDIPVCQLSVQSHQNAEYHLNMGKALAPLKSEGILIIGSGSATHNLGSLSHSYSSPIPWAQAFDNWLTESLTNNRYEEVINYEVNAPHAKKAHPYPEHFYPLHVALGAAGESAKAELVHTSWSLGTLSYSSYEFKSA